MSCDKVFIKTFYHNEMPIRKNLVFTSPRQIKYFQLNEQRPRGHQQKTIDKWAVKSPINNHWRTNCLHIKPEILSQQINEYLLSIRRIIMNRRLEYNTLLVPIFHSEVMFWLLSILFCLLILAVWQDFGVKTL